MTFAWSVDRGVGRRSAAVASAMLLALLAPFAAREAGSAAATVVSIIVREAPGAGDEPETAVERLGGRVGLRLGIIDSFSAQVPADRVGMLARARGVGALVPDARVRLNHTVDGFDGATSTGSMYNTAKAIRALDLWRYGITGRGVDVALIDSGVVPVTGLTTSGKVINGPDLSFESQDDAVRYLDTYGHGTHMAGIIAGRDPWDDDDDAGLHDRFLGVAPGSRILNVKVANAVGATDVSQVIAAIDWVVQHRTDNEMNVRVLNLSFGTDGVQDYMLDPLAYAAEVAWRKGIVVVVAAGNAGYGSSKLNNPAYDPYVIAVGADDTKGTNEVGDDTVPDWSSRGDGKRNPDIVAPGKSIVSLRDPGSYTDTHFPEGKVNDRFFRGSGTSQAAAVVSGAAALLLQHRPSLTPDQVKYLLGSTASSLPNADPVAQGAGLINLKSAAVAQTPSFTQTWPTSTGTGSLDAARGSAHVSMDGVDLVGEKDIFGNAWDGASWSGASWSGASWSGGTWNGASWSGASWSGASWSGASWSGASWSGASWSGASWSGASWSGASWSGASWSGASWSGASWSGASWSGASWSGASWSSSLWGTDGPDVQVA